MESEKYKLGKYYTPQDVVDVILATCVRNGADKILDPACGPGRFLVRAFSRLVYLNKGSLDTDFSEQLFGVDFDLESINLAQENLSKVLEIGKKEKLHVLRHDFFDVQSPRRTQTTFETWRKEDRIPIVNAVVGNPPYTRQEELTLLPFGNKYKDKVLEVLLQDYPNLKLSKMAGIYAYFFIHAASFLPLDKSRLGFVALRSWMDTRYGSDLQRFLLDNFKVLLIIESDVEKWFADAQMLPCIIALETCSDAQSRSSNLVKFVRLKQPLSKYWSLKSSDESERWQQIDNFASSLENAATTFKFAKVDFLGRELYIHESSSVRIVMLEQRFLRDDTKWGKYLVAPAIFFKIMKQANDLLSPLSKVATVYRGVTTGANDFFLFPNKSFRIDEKENYLVLIEKRTGKERFCVEFEYLRPLLRSVRHHRLIPIKTSDGFILIVNASKEELEKAGKKVLEYIKYGESVNVRVRRGLKDAGRYITGFNNLPTTRSRKFWYSLPDREPAPIIFPNIFWGRYLVFFNKIGVKPTNAFYEIYPKDSSDTKMLCALLNSTLSALFAEFSGRYIENRDGTRSNQLMIYEVSRIPIIDPEKAHYFKPKIEKAFDDLVNVKINPTFFADIHSALRKLDSIIFRDILGLSEDEMDDARKKLTEIINQRLKTSDHRFLNAQRS